MLWHQFCKYFPESCYLSKETKKKLCHNFYLKILKKNGDPKFRYFFFFLTMLKLYKAVMFCA